MPACLEAKLTNEFEGMVILPVLKQPTTNLLRINPLIPYCD